MKCPDCRLPIDIEATTCRCGWRAAPVAGAFRVAGEPRPVCRTVGCAQPAMNGFAHCQACDERIRHAQAEEFCKSQGLDTVEKKRAYCLKLARTFGRGRGGFESWANNLKQEAVDRLVLMDGKDDQAVLDRMRSLGIIDGRNKIIPPGEARVIAAEAARAERARQIAKVQADLDRLAEKFGPLNAPAETEVKA